MAEEMVRISYKTQFFDSEGIVLLTSEVPTVEISAGERAKKKIEKYYTNLSDFYLSFATKSVFPKLKEKYALSDDPRKRFTFRRYNLSLKIKPEFSNSKYISFSRNVCFSVHGKPLFSQIYGETFDAKRGTVMSMSRFLSKKKLKRQQKTENKANKTKICGFFLNTEGKPVAITKHNGRYTTVPVEY